MSKFTIVVTLDGAPCALCYYPAGAGRRYDGFVTNITQLRRALARHYGARAAGLELYAVGDRRLNPIATDAHLRRQVEALADGTTLLITATDGALPAPRRYSDDTATSRRRRRYMPGTGAASSTESPRTVTQWSTTAPATATATTAASLADVNSVVAHFAVHAARCEYCRCAPIRGVCYALGRHSACRTCAHATLTDAQRRQWSKRVLPWREDAPRAPLRDDGYNAVCEDTRHLQYLLTRLGYLKLSATSALQGSYQSRTADAVARLKRHYHIGGDMRVYDHHAAVVLAAVVRQLRHEGVKYL